LENFRSDVNAVRGRVVGSLNFGVLDTTITDGNNRLPEALSAFKRAGPDVQISLIVTSPSEIARAISDGRLHAGIATAHHREPGLVYDELYREQALLYCGRGHPLFEAAPNAVRIQDIREMDYVSRGYEEERQFVQKKIQARTTALAYPLEGVATMILSGRFIGIMPIHYAQFWVERDRLRPILPKLLVNETSFFLITKREKRQAPVLKAFQRELAAVYSSLQAGEPAAAHR
jgi:DNA-binding transcriptional LysR family regulator